MPTSAQAIGSRYEQMTNALDGMMRLLEQLRAIDPLVAQLRGPLAQEYEDRRADHAELIALRQMHETMDAACSSAQAREREAIDKLSATEVALAESEAVRANQANTLEERAIDIDRRRNEFLQIQLRTQHLESALRDAIGRNNEMEHDVASLRGHLDEIDRRRADAEAGLARSTQSAALLAEEMTVVRARADQAAAEVTRLSRIESDIAGQLAAQRARVNASEASALAAQAEATRVARSLETQLEIARADLVATQMRLETANVRAVKLEELNAEIGSRLAQVETRQQFSERLLSERQTMIDRLIDRVRLLEEDAQASHQRHASVETARAAAVERADQLAKSLAGHERAVERAEARATQSRAKLEKLMAGHDATLREQDQQIKAMQREIEKGRAEAALAEGALETVRRDRDRLQATLFGGTSSAAA